MRQIVSLILGLICFTTQAKLITTKDCLKIDGNFKAITTHILLEDFNIPSKKIQWQKTQIVLLNEEKVDYPFASYLARKDILKGRNQWFAVDKLNQLYLDDNAKNLVVKVSYFNQENKQITFLASAIKNNNDCSLAFNGYLIIKREF